MSTWGAQPAPAAQLDAGRAPIVCHGVSALAQEVDGTVNLVSVQADVKVTVVPRLAAENCVHRPTTIDHRLHPRRGEEL